MYSLLREKVIDAGFAEVDETIDTVLRMAPATPDKRLIQYLKRLRSYFENRAANQVDVWRKSLNKNLDGVKIESVEVMLPSNATTTGVVPLADLSFDDDAVQQLGFAIARVQLMAKAIADLSEMNQNKEQQRGGPGMEGP